MLVSCFKCPPSRVADQSVMLEHENTALPDRTTSTPSPAVEAVSNHMSTQNTPRLDTDMREGERTDNSGQHLKEEIQKDGFDPEINRVKTPPNPDGTESNESKEDSFVGQIKTRTPAKRVCIIEDSVEALDALEDEIERMDQAIPATKSNASSPTDLRKLSKPKAKASCKKPARSSKPTTAPASTSKPMRQSRPTKTLATGPESQHKPTPLKPAKSLSPTANETSQNLKPSSEIAPVLAKGKVKGVPTKRVSSLHKPPFQPVKSTKPPTRSTFELPGEAIARKLKEQREERQKREEEEQVKSKELKTRPVRRSQAPEVKLTAAAKARLSMARHAPADHSKSRASMRTSIAPTVCPKKGQSTLTVSKRSAPNTNSRTSPSAANTLAKRGQSFSADPIKRQPSISMNEPRAAPTADDLAQQKLKGKEVFGRTKAMLSEKQHEKKAKEEAARKARAEAAERGRIASREWAERQKARKAGDVQVAKA